MFSPLTKKRFGNFWRIRRARYSLLLLAALFLVSLFAEFVSPCKPGDVADPKTLEPYRTVRVSIVPDVRCGRLNLLPGWTAIRTVCCEPFLDEGAKFDTVYSLPDTFRKAVEARFAGEARPHETFELEPVAGGEPVRATLPEYNGGKAASVRVTLRQGGEQRLPVQLLFRRNGPVSERKWLREVPADAREEVRAMVAEAFTGTSAPEKRFPWGTVSCARDEISWPYPPVKGHPFGIDSAGRDVFTHIVYGMRISLLFGFLLVVWAVSGGILFGSLQGYFGGWVDILGQRVTEIWSAMPFLYVMIFVGSALGRSFGLLLICYGLFNWIGIAAYMRAEFLRLRHMTFVEAAKCQGLPTRRILFSHILPNALTPLVTLFPFSLIGAISSLASLDFLGFGLPPLTPSWGELLHQAQQFRWAWWLILFPAGSLFTVMLLAVLVGEGLRDAFDPRRQSRME